MADDIKLLKDAINVGEKTLLKFINKNISKKEKALHQLQTEENKLHSRVTTTKSKYKNNEAQISSQNRDDEIDDGSEEEDNDEEDEEESDEEETEETPKRLDQPSTNKRNNTTGNKDIVSNRNPVISPNSTSTELVNTVNNTKFNELVDLIVQSLNNNKDVKENVQTVTNETTIKEDSAKSTENIENSKTDNLKQNFTTNNVGKASQSNMKTNNNNLTLPPNTLLNGNVYQLADTAKSMDYDSSLRSVDKQQGLKKVILVIANLKVPKIFSVFQNF